MGQAVVSSICPDRRADRLGQCCVQTCQVRVGRQGACCVLAAVHAYENSSSARMAALGRRCQALRPHASALHGNPNQKVCLRLRPHMASVIVVRQEARAHLLVQPRPFQAMMSETYNPNPCARASCRRGRTSRRPRPSGRTQASSTRARRRPATAAGQAASRSLDDTQPELAMRACCAQAKSLPGRQHVRWLIQTESDGGRLPRLFARRLLLARTILRLQLLVRCMQSF